MHPRELTFKLIDGAEHDMITRTNEDILPMPERFWLEEVKKCATSVERVNYVESRSLCRSKVRSGLLTRDLAVGSRTLKERQARQESSSPPKGVS